MTTTNQQQMIKSDINSVTGVLFVTKICFIHGPIMFNQSSHIAVGTKHNHSLSFSHTGTYEISAFLSTMNLF